jgi:hypothetical protein
MRWTKQRINQDAGGGAAYKDSKIASFKGGLRLEDLSMLRISGVDGAIVSIDLTEFQSRSHVPEVRGSKTLALRSEVIRSRIIGRPKQCMISMSRLKDGIYEVVPKNANLIDTDRPEEWPELFTDAHVTLLQPVQVIPEDDLLDPDRR